METKNTWFVSKISMDYGTLVMVDPNICVMKGTDEEAEKNAALIAAAPDLLKALETLRDTFIHKEGESKGNKARTDMIKYNDEVKEALNFARTVIDKAVPNN